MMRLDIVIKDGTTGWIDYTHSDGLSYVEAVMAQDLPVKYYWRDENGQIKTRWGLIAEVL